MWNLLKQLYTSPPLSEQELSETAYWLKVFLGILVFLLFIVGFIAPLLSATNPFDSPFLAPDLATLAVFLFTLLLLHRGYVKSAAGLTLAFLYLVVVYVTIGISGGIQAFNTLYYFVLIPLTGLLLGRRSMVLFSGLCAITVSVIFYLEVTHQLVPHPQENTLLNDLAVWFSAIGLNTILLMASIRRAENSAKAERQSAQALLAANQELQQSQSQLEQARDELEVRVEQRTDELQQANVRLQYEVTRGETLLNALSKSEAKWRSLVENVPEMIATVARDQTITFINRSLEQGTAAKLIGLPVTLVHTQPQYQAKLAQAVEQVLQSGASVSYESEETKFGGSLWYVNRVSAIQQESQIVELIFISTDITEQKQTQTAMHQAQKTESLGMMAGGIAHDFNNLLTAILAHSSLVSRELATDQRAQRHIQQIIKAAERATDLTRQMLNYSGRGSAEKKTFDLNLLITDNLHLFSAAIAKNVTLTSTLAPHLWLVQGDQSQIQQVIMNLILNGADAIGQSPGTLRVSTESVTLLAENAYYGQWTGAPLSPGDYVKIEIQDTGAGMDRETMNRIFDPFFTTKRTGRGLGLASVIGIIRGHQGGLQVISTPGQGTAFQLMLPAFPQRAVATLATLPQTKAVALGGKLVLIIDDEPDTREATAEILKAAAMTVICADGGVAGLQLFEQHHAEISLILLDLSMPGLSGEETLRRLRILDPQVPIILISGYDENEVVRRLDDSETVNFLHKPYAVDTLLASVQSHLAQYELPRV